MLYLPWVHCPPHKTFLPVASSSRQRPHEYPASVDPTAEHYHCLIRYRPQIWHQPLLSPDPPDYSPSDSVSLLRSPLFLSSLRSAAVSVACPFRFPSLCERFLSALSSAVFTLNSAAVLTNLSSFYKIVVTPATASSP